jgi:hypothetical protein
VKKKLERNEIRSYYCILENPLPPFQHAFDVSLEAFSGENDYSKSGTSEDKTIGTECEDTRRSAPHLPHAWL